MATRDSQTFQTLDFLTQKVNVYFCEHGSIILWFYNSRYPSLWEKDTVNLLKIDR